MLRGNPGCAAEKSFCFDAILKEAGGGLMTHLQKVFIYPCYLHVSEPACIGMIQPFTERGEFKNLRLEEGHIGEIHQEVYGATCQRIYANGNHPAYIVHVHTTAVRNAKNLRFLNPVSLCWHDENTTLRLTRWGIVTTHAGNTGRT
jgi:hypothetical protein